MQWWCSAQGVAWTWTWKPLLGVWVLVALLIVLGRRVNRWTSADSEEPFSGPPGRVTKHYYVGVFLLWAGLDWPLGPLGAGYLASVHVTQFLLVGIAAPAFLLLGTPRHIFLRVLRRPILGPVVQETTSPLLAFIIFNLVMTLTHWPWVVDRFMASQVGSLALDVSWLVAGLVFWWPVVAPYPRRDGFHPLLKIGYLAFNAVLIRPPFAILVFSEHPVYEIYELAPPFLGRNPMHDQQLAGGIMKIGTAWAMAVGILFLFTAWRRREDEREWRSSRQKPTAHE